MSITKLAAALLGGLLAFVPPTSGVAQTPPALRVIRVTPSAAANPLSQITVTFDRPVAGSLDRTVDPTTILRVEPAIAAHVEWRDPVTLRLVPNAPLKPGASYTVTVANTFRSMDGSALAEPYRFTFRVSGPMLLASWPASPDKVPPQVRLDQRFELVYSSPVDLARLSAAAYLEFSAACSSQRIYRLRATGQRTLGDGDPWQLHEAGGGNRDRSLDSLRRVVQLVPEMTLPHGCAGEIVAPAEADQALTSGTTRFPFATYGDLRLTAADCGKQDWCPRGPIVVQFTTPVSGAEVMRNIHLLPATPFSVNDTLAESATWTLDARLTPRVAYAIYADTAIRDIYHQSLRGNPAAGYRTTGYAPSINYPYGHLLVERIGMQSLSVQHINVDTLIVTIAPIPAALEPKVVSRFGWATDTVWTALMRNATTKRIAVHGDVDRAMLTNVHLPVPDARRANAPTLYAVKISGRAAGKDAKTDGPIAVVQVTNLGVHVKVGTAEAEVWVTGANDGLPRAGASVALYDVRGRLRATSKTDARGLAHLAGWNDKPPKPTAADSTAEERSNGDSDGYIKVTLGDDRAITDVNHWDADLSPWRFNVSPAWGDDRIPVAGALFTERGIYRPGERVFAKAIVRDGSLGALHAPPAGDSIQWLFRDREDGVLRSATVRLTSFGTSSQTLDIPASAAVGEYRIETRVKRQGEWRMVGETDYRVAEYRPPEFLVDVTAQPGTHFPNETFTAAVQARYLFGAPMGRAVVSWEARQTPLDPSELAIPGTDGWYLGGSGAWWEDEEGNSARVFASGADTLDTRGERRLAITLPEPLEGRPSRVTIQAAVVDVNRQVVAGTATTVVHPASFYIAAKPIGKNYFWQTGEPQSVDVMAVRPDGQKVPAVGVTGTVVRREWHRVRRERDGVSEVVGDWVSDTVGTCNVTTAAAPQRCTFTPTDGGTYILTFRANDANGRAATTSFERWAAGSDWVPWSDETQFKMDVIPDRARYSVGDTATVLFASPFTNAEAWVTVEREGLIEQRRVRITSGSTTLKFPITEAFAPNAFVSILVARGRSAPPGPADDPGRPTIRVGYTEIRVTPEIKRLTVSLANTKPEYRPGDTAHVRIRVRDAHGRGVRSEVTLWAVDQGVLALTGYKTPDPIDLVYQERGLGMLLGSNMTAVAPQVPEGEKGKREAGGGGGAAGADVLRSRFQTTAFFLATVVTDANGNAVATAKLPDNLTTFRVMAVAVTNGDRYGDGETTMLVTRPLLARQALPRFVRPGDQFTAGAVINRRDGAAATVRVKAQSAGVTLRGDSTRTVTLAALRGAEVRFPFLATHSDTATFRFDVADDRPGDADAVRVSIPVRPEYHPRAHTVAGVMRDTATVELSLPANIDPARSRLSISLGSSPLASIRGMSEGLRVYPYECTEQVVSAATPIVALYRAQVQRQTELLPGNPRSEIETAVVTLLRRQRTDGGIGYWSSTDWSTAWLSAYAGAMLLDARDAGVKVDSAALSRVAQYVSHQLHDTTQAEATPVSYWYQQQSRMLRLRDQVAAIDFLSRFGRPDIAAENELLRTAAMLSLEDRARLAQLLARRGQSAPARQLMASVWSRVHVDGRRAVIADSTAPHFYFESYIRPYARVLTATLAVDPASALIGPLVETLAMQGKASRATLAWNTQDYASAVTALAAFEQRQRGQASRAIRVASAGTPVFQAAGVGRDSSVALTGLLANAPNAKTLRLSLDAGPGTSMVFYYLTVNEIPLAAPVTPEDAGVRVERWYERYETGTPVTTVAEGDIVRVRLRVTVPTTRQFLVLDDALPAGLEAIDLSLRTASALPGPGTKMPDEQADHDERERQGQQPITAWNYGYWDSGWWSPFDHRELRDDRVVYSATVLWPGTYTATYLARATTAGTFIRPPAHAEEMYNPGVNGRSDGGTFVVTEKKP
jgi:uncharacterized protein YfaS (alpha-2-macroglobulin family)